MEYADGSQSTVIICGLVHFNSIGILEDNVKDKILADTVIVLRGKLDWAKVLGKPRPHTGNPKYDKGPYWSLDLTPDAESLEKVKKYGFANKLKDPEEIRRKAKKAGKVSKEDRTEDFLSFRHLAKNKDGDDNKPLKIVDVTGQAWPDDKLLGNGTIADVKVKVVDYGSASDKGTYIQAIRVLEHVPYEGGSDFEPLSEDDEFFAAKPTAELNLPTTFGVEPAFDVDGAKPFETNYEDDVPF
jgi:hypothetical protein